MCQKIDSHHQAKEYLKSILQSLICFPLENSKMKAWDSFDKIARQISMLKNEIDIGEGIIVSLSNISDKDKIEAELEIKKNDLEKIKSQMNLEIKKEKEENVVLKRKLTTLEKPEQIETKNNISPEIEKLNEKIKFLELELQKKDNQLMESSNSTEEGVGMKIQEQMLNNIDSLTLQVKNLQEELKKKNETVSPSSSSVSDNSLKLELERANERVKNLESELKNKEEIIEKLKNTSGILFIIYLLIFIHYSLYL